MLYDLRRIKVFDKIFAENSIFAKRQADFQEN